MLSPRILRSVTHCSIAIVTLATLLVASPSVFAGSTWSRAIGEAKELQRPTKDLRNRLSRLYPYDPATSYAVALDEVAQRLISHTRNETPVFVLESDLNRFSALYEKMRLIIAANHQLATDRNVSRYTVDIGKRFDYLVKDIQRALPKLPAYAVQPFVPSQRPVYRSMPPQYVVPEQAPFYAEPSYSSSSRYRTPELPPRISVEIALPRISL